MTKFIASIFLLALVQFCVCQNDLDELKKALTETVRNAEAEKIETQLLKYKHEGIRIACERNISTLTYTGGDQNRQLMLKLSQIKRLQASIIKSKIALKSSELKKSLVEQQQERVAAAKKFMELEDRTLISKKKESLLSQCKELERDLSLDYLELDKPSYFSHLMPRSLSRRPSTFYGSDTKELLLDTVRQEKQELKNAEEQRKIHENLNEELAKECSRRMKQLENGLKESMAETSKAEEIRKKYAEEEKLLERQRMDLLFAITRLGTHVEGARRRLVAYCEDIEVM